MKTLKFLKLFENFIILIFFLNSMKFLKVLKFYENFEFKKKNEIFKFVKKNWTLNFYFFLFYDFQMFWKFSNFMKFFNILISKKQFLCNTKPYCTRASNFIHWFCTRVQYVFLLHRNCFLLINMLENFNKFQNFQKISKL